jgi:CO dehydrogenase/acetyl-CoA synthase beta subunit
MGLFNPHLDRIRDYLAARAGQTPAAVFTAAPSVNWPSGGNSNLVLSAETAVELGSPKTAATSFLLWTDLPGAVRHGVITLIGPDISRETRPLTPFGKAVLLEVSGFDETNSYDRWRELELAKYDVSLAGYMMRAVSQYQREWSRISRKAVADGFSLSLLGGALIRELMKKPYVRGVEVIFVTSTSEDVLALKAIGDSVAEITGAMNKMVEEMDFDCSSCEFKPVCDDVSELRSMRKAMKEKTKTSG